MMKIEIWSDYVCPFCYIGKKQLENALEKFPQKSIEIEFKSYQLDPNTPLYSDSGKSFYEGIAEKYGGGVEQAKQMMAGIVEQAKTVGLDFNFETMKPTNTFDAHRLTKFAHEHGKSKEVAEKLLYGNFTESEDISDYETLADIAAEAGLNREDTLTTLQDENAYADNVRDDIREAQTLGVTAVPYFVFNRKYALSGAQPQEAFEQALQQIFDEEKSAPQFQDLSAGNDADGACGVDGCEVPEEKE